MSVGVMKVCSTAGAAANLTLTLSEYDTSFREGSSKLSTFTDLTQFDSVNSTRINCESPLAVADDYEWICFTAAAYATLTLCEWDASLGEVGSKLHKVMALKKADRVDPALINCGAPLVVGDVCERVCFTAGAVANLTLTLSEYDTSLREGSRKLSTLTDLTLFDSVNSTRINWGAPLAVADDYQWICFTAAAKVTLTLCEWDASLGEVSSKLHKFMAINKPTVPISPTSIVEHRLLWQTFVSGCVSRLLPI